MATFAQIQDEIASMLSTPDDELSPEQRLAMETYLDDLGGMEASKIDAFAQFMRIQEEHAEACKNEASRLSKKARTVLERLGYLEAKYIEAMRTNSVKKIAGHAYTVSVRENIRVHVGCDVMQLPDFYRREKLTVEPEKTLLREALKAGIEIEGCELVNSYSLQIR